MDVRNNLKEVQRKIKGAAERVGRNPKDVRLVVVTKEAESRDIEAVLGEGVTELGENKVKQALSKKAELGDKSRDVKWHMIGHLQSNKAKDAVKMFCLIHSVDTLKLAEIIDKEAGRQNKEQEILLEVNVSGEKSKFGICPAELGNILEEANRLTNIKVSGLMTMAPFGYNSEKTRPIFQGLKRLALEYRLEELSMGMTQDFETAVEEGATMVRVGSAIFKG